MKPKFIQKKCYKHGLTEFVLEGRGYYRCKKCRSFHVANRRRTVKNILVKLHGGECKICGYSKCQQALQFHHLDREEKTFALSHKGLCRNIAKSKEEAKKCILLCANCHAEVENNITDLLLGSLIDKAASC